MWTFVHKVKWGRTCLLGPSSRICNISTLHPLSCQVWSRSLEPLQDERQGSHYVMNLLPHFSFQNLSAGVVHSKAGWNAVYSWVTAHILRAKHYFNLQPILGAEVSWEPAHFIEGLGEPLILRQDAFFNKRVWGLGTKPRKAWLNWVLQYSKTSSKALAKFFFLAWLELSFLRLSARIKNYTTSPEQTL